MSEKLNLYQRLNEAMKLVHYVRKDGQNPSQKYMYATHDAVTKKAREALIEVGVKAIPSDISIEKSRDENGRSVTTILKMEIDFINIDDPEDHRVIVCFGEGTDPQDKGIGKAKSYALKYAYLKILGLETGLDPEQDSIPRYERSREDVLNNVKNLYEFLKEGDKELEGKMSAFISSNGYSKIDDLPTKLLERVEQNLESKRGKAI